MSSTSQEAVSSELPENLARRSIEAMRLGVVPVEDALAYTVGRDDELERVDADLARAADEGGALRAFLGDYGTGKTHMLEIIRERALEEGFLAARAVLDPEETAPSHPKRVYRSLVRSLEYPDRPAAAAGGLEPLFEAAMEGAKDGGSGESDEVRVRAEVAEQFLCEPGQRGEPREHLDEGAHLYLTPALRYFRRLRALESGPEDSSRSHAELEAARALLMDWIEGDPTVSNNDIDRLMRKTARPQGKIYSMLDYRPWARIYGYILSGVSTLARLAGYRGLVVLVDEAEFYSLLSKQNREYARILFKALAWASMGEAGGSLPFERSELDLGGYGVQQELPPRYGEAPGLYTVFAMTPHHAGMEALQQAVPPSAVTELRRFREADYQALVGRVLERYRRAYDPEAPIYDRLHDPLSDLVDGLLSSGHIENPRAAMKFLVEFLDIARMKRDRMKQVIGELREIYGSCGFF